MIHKFSPYIIIILQTLACIWYLLPENSSTHVPGGFIKMIIFGSTALLLLIISTILYLIYKPSELIWKMPFIIFIIMILLGWFYNK